MTYYNVGKLLIEAQGGETRSKYGDKLIKEIREKLKNEENKEKYEVIILYQMKKTIGLIICKNKNKYIIEYSSDKRIYSREYIII